MADLELALLGSPVVSRGGVQVTFDTRKAVALLAVLAVSRHPQSRERLAGLLWPDSDASRARSALRRTLSVTVAAVGGAVHVDRSAVSLASEGVADDVSRFEALVEAGDLASLEQAAALYRDDFLAGFALRDSPEFDDWQAFTSEGLRQRLAGALESLVAAYVARGDLERALTVARRWLNLDPLHEPAHRALIELYDWTGQRSSALRQYRACVRVLDRELGVPPLSETTALYDAVRADRHPATPLAPRPVAAAVPPPPPATTVPAAAAATPLPLRGRDDTLAALDRLLARDSARGAAAAVAGEAGIGKTRVVEEAVRAVARSGSAVVTARCHEGESALAFGVAIDLLRAAVRQRPELVTALSPAEAAELARLVPDAVPSVAAGSAPPLDGPGAQARLYAAVGAALVAATAGTPAGLVVVEDAHWADHASADLLGYLLRRLPDLELRLLLTWRPESLPASGPLRSGFAAARRAGAAGAVELGPLTAEQVADLVGDLDLPAERVARLYAETRGVPFLVTEYVEALRAGRDNADLSVPEAVRELLADRLQAAGETTVQLLAAAAVIGGRCDTDLLRATSGRGEAETVDAIDEAVRRRLLVEVGGTTGAPGYDFPYDALRQVALDNASLARRRLLHGRAADALVRRADRDGGAAPSIIADHLLAAGREPEAAEWFWRAAEGARALWAHREALAHLRAALALGYDDAAVHTAIGDVLTVLGSYAEALTAFERAAAAHEDDDLALAGVEHRLAEVNDRLGEWAVAQAHLEAAFALVTDGHADPAARLLAARVEADRALVAYRLGRLDEAQALAADALERAGSGGDATGLAQAHDVLGVLAAARGDTASSEVHLEESLRCARTLDDPSAAVAALNNLARLRAALGRPDEALAAAEEALALGVRHGDAHRVAALHSNLADLLHGMGRGDEALEQLKLAARGFAAVDQEALRRPEIWKLVQW